MQKIITIEKWDRLDESRFKLETSDGVYYIKDVAAGQVPPLGTFDATYELVGERRVVSVLQAVTTQPTTLTRDESLGLLGFILMSPALGSVPKNENEIPEIVEAWFNRLSKLVK